MGILNHLIFSLSLFTTIQCQNVRSGVEMSTKASHEGRPEWIIQQEDHRFNIERPLKIQPSRAWVAESSPDSKEARLESMEGEKISWNGERDERNIYNQDITNVVGDDDYHSSEMRDSSVEKKASLQLVLIQDILFSGNQSKQRHRARRSASSGSPPRLNASIGNLNASYCSLFYFRIPENIFVDEEDGSTRNLSLSLYFDNGTLVDSTSWLQLDGNLQTLYGFLKVSDDALTNSENSFLYKLRATDSSGLTAEAPFSVKIPSKPPEVYFRMDLVVNNLENLERPDVNEVLFLAYRVFNFFKDLSFSNLNVLSFQRNHSQNAAADRIAFGWTNCTISGNNCPIEHVKLLINTIIMPDGTPSPSFSASLQPQYVIHVLKATMVGACQELNTSVQPSPTPANSLSPIIMTTIPELSVSTTTYFTYQIPMNTFYDSTDGYTRSLNLQLRTADDSMLMTSSWLQFETTTQTIFGILTSNLFSSSITKYFSYILIATNSRGYSSRMVISFKGDRQAVSFGARFLLQGRDNSLSSTYDVTILSKILQNLRKYLTDANANTIEVQSFTRTVTGQQKVFSLAYFNTTITTENCAGLDQLIPVLKGEGTLIHQDLTVALVPEIVADRIDISRYGNCSVYATQTVSPSPTPVGQFPSVQNRVPVIAIKTGIFFRYQIPTNSFYDAIDGNTAKLTLQVVELNGSALGRTSWIQFDEINQNLYGLLPTNQQTIRPFQNFTYLLRVQNSKGNAITQAITIKSEFVAINVGVVVTFTGRDYSGNQWNNVQLQSFMITQLRGYLGIKSNTTILMLSFEQQPTSSSQFSALWTDSRLTSTECNPILLRNLELKIFSSKGIVHSNLISTMLPNVAVGDAKISYNGQCSQNQTTNSPIYATTLPIINVNTGFLFTYTIPRATFMDNIDGDTKSLLLSLSNIDGSAINSSSRIQLNSSIQKITGIYLDEDLNGASSRAFNYALTALNSRNFTTSAPLSILATQNWKLRGISVITTTNILSSDRLNTVKLSIDFLHALRNYIQPSVIADFSIISVKQAPTNMQLVTITWSYNKINVITCNRTKVDQFKALLNNDTGQLNPQFINAMTPDFGLLASETRTPYACNASFSSEVMIQESTNIAPTQSIPLMSSASSVVASTNNPPSVTSKILPLFAYFCTPFSYTIPSDLFYDQEQGGTRNLQIHLENHNRQQVGTTSWLQFSKPSQVLYGILKIDDYYRKPFGGYKYYLVATDSQGLQAATDFTITIPESPIKYNHVINMTLNRMFDNSVPDVNEQLLISTKILDSLGDGNSNNINLISYENVPSKNRAVFTWSNCSLTYSPCPTIELGEMLIKITDRDGKISESFKNSMLSQYTVYSIKTEKLAPCNGSEQLNTPMTSVFISPSPSVPVSLSPTLQTPLGQLNVTWCAPFVYQIPANTFNDANEGSTRQLSLEMLHLNGSQLAKDYWLKFDKKTQTISAYPTLNDIEQYEITRFLITARNSRNLTASQIIAITATTLRPRPSHQLLVRATAYVTTGTSDVDIRSIIYNKMKAYFTSTEQEVVVFTNYTRTGQSPAYLLYTFSYCSLTENACDRSGLDSMLTRIFSASGAVNSDLIIAFSPEIVMEAITVENLGQCSSTVATPSWIHSSIHEVMSSRVVVAARNQKPLVLQTIGILQVEPCKLFSYTVPERLFYDVEDGFTRNLMVTVTTLNGTALSDVSWITFNSTTQTLIGVIASTDNEELQYTLVATDKGGLSVSQPLEFKMQKNSDPLIFLVNTTVTSHFPERTPRASILEYFINKLGVYLSGTAQISTRIISFEKSSNRQVNISWTTCNAVDNCNATFLSAIQTKLTLQGGIVNPSLVTALGPNLLVTNLQIKNIQQCASTAAVPSTSHHYMTIPTSTLFVSTTVVHSSTIVPNNPPRFNKVLPVLQVSPCNPFSVQLPSDLCIDPEDGISGTKIAVAYRNGSSISTSSFLQLNNINKTIYGITKESDFLPNGQLRDQFLVSCEDTKGFRISRNLDLNATSSFTEKNSSYSLTFQVYFYALSALPDVDIQMLWIQKLSKYLQHPSGSSVLFLNFKRFSSIQAEFSIRFCFLDACNYTDVSMVRNKIFSTIPYLNPDFIDSMIPEFSIVSTTIQSPSIVICPTTSSPPLSTQPQSSSITFIHNASITVLRSIPLINITLCRRFQYVIPLDTFYAKEDGYTSNLTVALHYKNNSIVGRSSWIQYENSTLSITGYIVHEVAVTAEMFEFKLIAKDSRGSTASVAVMLKLLSKYKTVNHYYRTEAELYEGFQNNIEIMAEAASKIKAYIGGKIDKGVFFVNFVRYDYQQPKVVFTWGSCALLDACDQTSLRAVSDRLLLSGTILNLQFVAALAPKIVVTKVTQSSNTNCSGISTSEAMSVATQVTSTMPDFMTTTVLSSNIIFPEIRSEMVSPSSAYTSAISSMVQSFPIVRKSFNPLLTAICNVLLYQVANNIFYDANDGYTRNLKVTARPQNQPSIPDNYWLQFDSTSQTFIGQPTVEAVKMQPQNGYLFIVRATNKLNFFTETSLIIKIDRSYPDINHNITLYLEEIGPSTLGTLDAISFIRNKTSFFFGDSASNSIGIIGYSRNITISRSINLTIYNCSIGSSSCDIFNIENYLSKMVDKSGDINEKFSTIFLPRFRLKQVTTSISDNCYEITSLLSKSLSLDVTNTRFTVPPFIQSIASTVASTESQTISKYALSSVIKASNSPPVALKSINISLPFCGSLRYAMPNDVIYDKEDGGFDRLNLRLSSVTGNTTDCNSTVRLNRTNNEIYGSAVLSMLRTPMDFLLTAQDKEGLAATTTVSFSTPEWPQYTTFTVTFRIKPVGIKCTADAIEDVRNALQRHLPFTNISILHYEGVNNNGLQIITWTDCSLLDEKCDSNRSSVIAQRIFPNNTVDIQLSSLMAQIGKIQSVSIFRTEICSSQQQMFINLAFCNKTKYVLKDSSFNSTVFNVQRQREDMLTYQLTNINGDVLSWAMFDSKTNSIVVLPVYNVLKGRSVTQLFLNATYNNTTVKRIGITLFHYQSTTIQLNYSISMKIISYKKATLNDIELLEIIRERLLKFANDWLIIDYNRTKIFPQTLHVTMAPCFTISECNETCKALLTSEVSLGNGVPSYNATKAFLPDLVLSQLSVTSNGRCYGSVAEKTQSRINVTVSLCTELYSPVKDNMLTNYVNNTVDDYELLDSSKKPMGLDSWVQFDRMKRVIYGLPTQRDLIDQPVNGYLFFLRVWKKTKIFEDVYVNITIRGNTTKPAYSQSIFYQSLSQTVQNKADILLDFRSKIAGLVGNTSVENIGFISFERRLDLSKISQIEYTNCSLLQQPGICDDYSSSLITRKTVLANGQPSNSLLAALGTNYTVIKIIEMRSNACGNSSNTSPRVIVPLPELNVSACARLEFPIPNDTFVDKEDGNAASLLLSLKAANSTSLKASSWIQFDVYTKTIYGIPTYDIIQNKPINGYSFLLEAKDSQNGVASVGVQVNLNNNVTQRSLVNVIVNTSFPVWTPPLEIQRQFLQRTEKCLNISKQSIGIAYYGQLSEARRDTNISIFRNCSNFLEYCDEASAKTFLDLFVTNSTVNEAYQTCMYSEFSIIQVEMSISRLCRNVTQNSPPLVKRLIPQLNISLCEALSYRIPNDTFSDVEDGLKILEHVELKTRTGEPVKKSDFVQFDKQTRMIYALFPYDFISNVSIYEYSLQVTDTAGDSVSTKVFIQPIRILHNFTYRVCVSLRRYSSTAQSDIDIIQNLLNRIEYFITNRQADRSFIAISYSIASTYPQVIDVCFSNCSFVNGTCDRSSVDATKRKVFIRDGVPTLEFRQTLNPDFIVLKATDAYAEYCTINANLSTVLPTSILSLTSSIITTPTDHCLSGGNSAPIVLNSIGTLTAFVGQPKIYSIGSDVIYDKEDGYLRISALTDMSGNEVQNSWIQYDKSNQRIYLSPIDNSMRGEKSFKVIGKDSCGTPVYDVIKIEVLGVVSCCYTIRLSSYVNNSAFSKNVKLQNSLYKRLTEIYNDTGQYLRLYSLRTGDGNYTEVSYTNSSFTNESCYHEDTKQLSHVAFYDNGTARKEFIKQLSDFQIFDAVVNNSRWCNATLAIVPPVVVTPPGSSNALTYQDWLWYMLPFIILAFLVICCCLLFYWCAACREACCGSKKADDLFTAGAAAKPIKEEEVMPQADKTVQDENPGITAQAAPAAKPLDERPNYSPDAIYADIGTTRNSSVPSMHRNKQLPLWMRQTANGASPHNDTLTVSPVPDEEEPMIEAVSAMPQEAPRDSIGSPITSNVESQPRRKASEIPLTASHIDNLQHRPSYLVTPSSSAASFQEDPLTQSVAPMTQDSQDLPDRQRVVEELINPVNRLNTEAELPMDFSMAPAISPDEIPQQAFLQEPNNATGPALRLPSIPFLPPGNLPPPYPSTKVSRIIPQNNIFEAQPKNNPLSANRTSKVRLAQRRRGPTISVEDYEMSRLSEPRLDALSRPKVTSLQYTIPKVRMSKPSFIRRAFSKPRGHIGSMHSSYTRKEPVVIERSPKSVRRYKVPSVNLRKSPSLGSYLTDSDTDVTSIEEQIEHSGPQIRLYGSKEISDPSDDDSQSPSEKEVPVEINGVVNAPESVLMNWMRDGTLKTTITNAKPTSEHRKKSRDVVTYKIKPPEDVKRRQKITKKHRELSLPKKRNERKARITSKPKRHTKRNYVDSPEMYIDDSSSLSDDIVSYDKTAERAPKRGYSFVKDPSEYVEFAMRSRRSARDSQERISRKTTLKKSLGLENGQSTRDSQGRNSRRTSQTKSLGLENGQMAKENGIFKKKRGKNKSERSISEILRRMSRRKELKRSREAFENEEFYAL